MSRYVAAQFNTNIREEIFQILSNHEFPTASFFYSLEAFCSTEGIPCSTCGVIMEEGKADDENHTNDCAYVFIEIPIEKCGKLVQDLTELEEMKLVLFAKSWNSLLMACIKVKCDECSEQKPKQQSISNLPPQPKTIRVNPNKFAVPADLFGKEEQNPLISIFQALNQPEPSVSSNSPKHSGENNLNEEYHWTKCKLCMRILRTKRADPSRMRTLQTSHARNHVSKMQYACYVCGFTCRFHGGIQLHMTRTHPDTPSNYMDRSREPDFKKEISDMVTTCFGSDIQIMSRGLRSEMYQLADIP